MADRYWAAAAEIAARQAGMRVMSKAEIQDLIRSVAATLHEVAITPANELKNLSQQSYPDPVPYALDGDAPPMVDPKEAVQFDFILCMECGEKFKILKKHHLKTHNLTPEEYRAKYHYPEHMPLMCLKQLKDRSKAMKKAQPWKQKAKTPEEKAAKAVTEEYIQCMECGARRQSITAPHLRKHGLTADEYRRKWGYAEDMPLMSGKQLKKQAVNASLEEAEAKPKTEPKPKAAPGGKGATK